MKQEFEEEDNVDEELMDLLNEADDNDFPDPPAPEDDDEPEPHLEKSQEEIHLETDEEELGEVPKGPNQVIKTSTVSSEDSPDDSGDADSDVVKKLETMIEGFGSRQDEIWSLLKEDRAKIDEYLKLFVDKIAGEDKGKGMYVEAIASLMSTKATTSMNATRVLDSTSKLISAAKNLKSDGADSDLAALLKESLSETDDDDEFDDTAP